MKRKDPLKNLTNQRRADVSSLMMNSLNGTISSKTLSRRISTGVIFKTLLQNEEYFLKSHLFKWTLHLID